MMHFKYVHLLFINYTSIKKKKRPKRHRSVLGDFTENHHLWHSHSHLATVHQVPTLCLILCGLIKKLPHGQMGWPLSVSTVLLCLRHKDSESCGKTSFNFRSVSLHATASKGIIYCVVMTVLPHSFSYCISACPYMWTSKRIHQERTENTILSSTKKEFQHHQQKKERMLLVLMQMT